MMEASPGRAAGADHRHVEMPPKKDCAFEVGVLFVHGMGQHERGGTLVRAGEPIISFLERWFDGASRPGSSDQAHTREHPDDHVRSAIVAASAEVNDAALVARPDRAGAPGCAEISLSSVNSEGQANTAKLMFAESWWTKSIVPPTFGDIMTWSLTIAPLLLITEAGRPLLRTFSKSSTTAERLAKVLWMPLALAYLVVGILLAPIVELVILALLVIAIVPIPQLRSVVAAVQTALLSTIGQSYVLVTGPIQFAAMAGQVSYDLRWLCERCRNVVIVAHSQGAAVAFHALRHKVPSEVKQLITVGSGLKQLEILLSERHFPTRTVATFFTLPFLWLLAEASGLINVAKILQGTWTWSVSNLDFGPRTWLALVFVITMLSIVFGKASTRSVVKKPTNLDWVDLYASRDPVPDGLYQESAAGDAGAIKLSSQMVYNRGSFFADHTTYWQNSEEIVGPIACRIAALAGTPITELTKHDKQAIAVAQERRHLRVFALVAVRYVIFFMIALWLLHKIGYDPAFRKALLDVLPYYGTQALSLSAWQSVLISLHGLIAGIFGYLLVFVAWSRWNKFELNVLFNRTLFANEPLIGIKNILAFSFCSALSVAYCGVFLRAEVLKFRGYEILTLIGFGMLLTLGVTILMTFVLMSLMPRSAEERAKNLILIGDG